MNIFTGLNSGKYHYEWFDKPIFEKYETVEEPTYCDECGNENGSYTYERGVNQIGTKRVKRRVYALEETMVRMTNKLVVDNILNTSTIVNRFLGNKSKKDK